MNDRDYEEIDTYAFVAFECQESMSGRLRDMWMNEELPRWYLAQLRNINFAMVYTAMIHGFYRNYYGESTKLR